MKRLFAGIIATLVTAIALAVPTPANAATACGNYLQTFSSSHTLTDALGKWYFATSFTKRGPNTCGHNAYISNCLARVTNGTELPARVRWIAPGGATHTTVPTGPICGSNGGTSTLFLLNRNGEVVPDGSLVRIEIRSDTAVTCHLRT